MECVGKALGMLLAKDNKAVEIRSTRLQLRREYSLKGTLVHFTDGV